MEYLAGFIADLIDNPNVADWVLKGTLALVMFVFALGLMLLVAGVGNPVRRRLRAIAGETRARGNTGQKMAASIENLRPIVMPKDEREATRIRAKLVQGGFRQQNAVLLFFATKTLLAVALPAMVLAVAPFLPNLSIREVVFYAMIAASAGVFGPNMALEKWVTHRQDAIRRGFPDALDLMVVCVEAGLGFDLAVQRIAKEMRHSHPVLANEFELIGAEIRAGVERLKALRHFAERTGIDDVQGFVALLSQSIRFGTGIGETLRIYAEDFRDKRTQKAEEQAAKVSTKLIFPMVLCFFPSFFVVATGPVILKVMEVLK